MKFVCIYGIYSLNSTNLKDINYKPIAILIIKETFPNKKGVSRKSLKIKIFKESLENVDKFLHMGRKIGEILMLTLKKRKKQNLAFCPNW